MRRSALVALGLALLAPPILGGCKQAPTDAIPFVYTFAFSERRAASCWRARKRWTGLSLRDATRTKRFDKGKKPYCALPVDRAREVLVLQSIHCRPARARPRSLIWFDLWTTSGKGDRLKLDLGRTAGAEAPARRTTSLSFGLGLPLERDLTAFTQGAGSCTFSGLYLRRTESGELPPIGPPYRLVRPGDLAQKK